MGGGRLSFPLFPDYQRWPFSRLKDDEAAEQTPSCVQDLMCSTLTANCFLFSLLLLLQCVACSVQQAIINPLSARISCVDEEKERDFSPLAEEILFASLTLVPIRTITTAAGGVKSYD